MSDDPFRLDATTVVVTGGGSGIGGAVARGVCLAGAEVVIVGRRRHPLDAMRAELGPRCHVLVGDVTDSGFVRGLPDQLSDRNPPVRGFVHAAGNHVKRPFLTGSAPEDAAVMDVHLTAAMELSRSLVPVMVEAGGGSVVLISSMAARLGIPSVPAYSAAKGGVVTFARALASEVGRDEVRVNVVTPGWIDTAMSRGALDDDSERKCKILRRTLLGRLGQPSDVGNAVVYLLSPAARFVTGAELTVDGGAAGGF